MRRYDFSGYDEEDWEWPEPVHEELHSFIEDYVDDEFKNEMHSIVANVEDRLFFDEEQCGGTTGFNVFNWSGTEPGHEFWNAAQVLWGGDRNFQGEREMCAGIVERYLTPSTPTHPVTFLFDDPRIMGR